MSFSRLVEYVRLIVLNEARIREAEISGNKKVPWGSDEHIRDLEGRLTDAEYWKKKCGRGSAKRSYYAGVMSHLKSELKSARKANQSLNEKQKEED